MNVTTPLSKTQERKAVQYVEDTFLDITSSFKKRSEPSMTRLPTLSSYLNAMQTLLAFILRIPPVDPSTPLRTTFLLRLTGDIMNSVTGYPPDMADFRQLLDFMDDLDQAWVAVLRSQIWDPTKGEGVDLIVPVDLMQFGNTTIQSTPVSQTERTRLRSLLLTGTAGLEEWLAGSAPNGEDYELQLEREGLFQEFNDLFANTLAEMGNFAGPPDNTPAVMETD
ncbi:hypothetical protein BKA82DRAFT_140500 [Pisolithus tinctorius]|uniref:Uncharacterized protein n=1 Tax=Pisolithus tinctorius Marx 270 TaxID=870435 RepID=A0A0C3NXX7_PISTI|nr:hypothetical protein BKA82DRAFT_140500 [Pisolithus tinctorius]KIO05680.1 hypothetical protein M404DRAFT_140500 [Pisolithus tinctorius Marx 270]